MKTKYLLISLFALCTSAYLSCQNKKLIKDSLYTISMNVHCDVENQIYIKSQHIKDSVLSTYYFTKKGDSISGYKMVVNLDIMNIVREYVTHHFQINDFTEVQGSAVLYVLIDCKNDYYETRLIRGMSKGFNKELLRILVDFEKENRLCDFCISNSDITTLYPVILKMRYGQFQ